MLQSIRVISVGGVNCFLVKAGDGFVMVDTSVPGKRAELEKELGQTQVKAQNLLDRPQWRWIE